MHPELYTFTIYDTSIPIMSFGVSLVVAIGLVYWMMMRLGKKYQVSMTFFNVHLVSFFFVTFFFSRIFHVIQYYGLLTKSAFSWDSPILSFFLMSDFYFSASGAMIGFFTTLLFLIRNRDKTDKEDILDFAVISWLFGAIVLYFGAFFGGQTYGIRSDGILSVDYINNPILAEFPRFPLAVVYAICIIFIFSGTYIIKKLRPERGLATGLGALLWGIMWFIGEWWNDASSDNIAYIFGFISDWKIFNLNQIMAFILICFGLWKLAHIVPSPLSDWIIKFGEKVEEKVGNKLTPVIAKTQTLYRRLRKKWKK